MIIISSLRYEICRVTSAVDLTNDSVNHSTADAKFRNKVLKKIRLD